MGIFNGIGAAFALYKVYFIGAAIVAALFAFWGMGATKNHYKDWGQKLYQANAVKQLKIDSSRDTVQAIGAVRAAGDRRTISHIHSAEKKRLNAAFRIIPVNGVYNLDQLNELGGR